MTASAPLDARTQERIDNLEIKAGFAEDLLDQLNLTIFRQQQQIDRLAAQLAQLNQQVQRQGAGSSEGAAARDPRDDIPPHY
ncbi:MAG: Protein SlyX [Paracidovorax wautersii]|uniref:Protein SlyX n=1 Tax=Paracidovorax wautersii TaxID=1177982 RepID=A0A7V8JP75_9BURK|nr:MAG: Protein SlyX [Paracidovorax wautersii]